MSLPPEETPTGEVPAGQSSPDVPLTRRQLREQARQAEQAAASGAAPSGDPAPELPAPVSASALRPDAPLVPPASAVSAGPPASAVSAGPPASAARPGPDEDSGRETRAAADEQPSSSFAAPGVGGPSTPVVPAAPMSTVPIPEPRAQQEEPDPQTLAFEALGIRSDESEDDAQTGPDTQTVGTEEEPVRRPAKPRPRVTVLGVLGELLLTAGVIVMLFLVWQLWLNDIWTRGEQNQAASDLVQEWGGTPDPSATPPPDVDYGPPVVMGQPGDAESFGVLYIPRFGADYKQTIAGGTSTTRVLNTIGLGHYDDTQMPGEAGNFALAGHRQTHGAPLNQIASLQVGDAIVVQTKDGWYTYRFRTLEYVTPTTVNVLNPIPQNDTVETTDSLITLTSCNPLFSTAERIIAYGVLESWQPSSVEALPPALTELED